MYFLLPDQRTNFIHLLRNAVNIKQFWRGGDLMAITLHFVLRSLDSTPN